MMNYRDSTPTFVLILVFGLLAACEPVSVNQSSTTLQSTVSVYRTLNVDQFADILANRHSEYKIINVHIPYAGEIEGTQANIPYNDSSALMTALPDKNAPIILYCRSGRMSKEASLLLLQQGYTQVWDIEGGMNAWVASGRSLVNIP
ncbi:MAG: rhodanese-like domain-containing protein [Chloroflexota bacterium]